MHIENVFWLAFFLALNAALSVPVLIGDLAYINTERARKTLLNKSLLNKNIFALITALVLVVLIIGSTLFLTEHILIYRWYIPLTAITLILPCILILLIAKYSRIIRTVCKFVAIGIMIAGFIEFLFIY